MTRLRAVVGHVLGRAALLFALFVAPWPGVRASYVGALAAALDAMLGSSGPWVSLSLAPSSDGSWDVLVEARELGTGRAVMTALDAHRTSFVPGAVFLALGLATRLSLRRKSILLSVGLLLVGLLPVLPVLAYFSGGSIPVFSLSTPARVLVEMLYRSLVAPLGMAYAVPVLVWLLLRWRLTPAAAEPPKERAATRGWRAPRSRKRGRRAPAAPRRRTA